MSFIPLINDNKNLISSETSLKYFLVQAIASSVLLFRIILFRIKHNLLNSIIINNNYIISIILSSLLLKRGTAPFHWWFPNVIEGLSWINALILITWQKIAPLILISYIIIKSIFLVCIITSVIIGSILGINQTSIRKLIAYSSINHLGWILAAIQSRESLWIIYFLFYSFLSINLIYIFNIYSLSHINQIFTIFFNLKIIKFFIFLNLLSLGGLPPFIGFIPKWLVIQIITINNQLLLIFIIIIITLITLFFYIRICYSAFIINYYELNINLSINYFYIKNKICIIISFFSIFGFFIIRLIYF